MVSLTGIDSDVASIEAIVDEQGLITATSLRVNPESEFAVAGFFSCQVIWAFELDGETAFFDEVPIEI